MKLSRRALLGVGTWALAGTAAPWAWAQAPAMTDADRARVERALASVAQARASLRTLTGPFTQSRSIGMLAAKVRSTGTLTLVRPDRLRWELAAPDDVVYWVTPEGLAYRSRRGTDTKAAPALGDLRILLGGDLSQLEARYVLTVSGEEDGPLTFDATPRLLATGTAATGTAAHLTFTLAKDRAIPVSATIVEGPRDRTEITFGALAKNVTVDPALVRPP